MSILLKVTKLSVLVCSATLLSACIEEVPEDYADLEGVRSTRPVITPVVTPVITPVVTSVITPVVTSVITPVVIPVITPVVTSVITPVVTPVITPVVTPVITPIMAVTPVVLPGTAPAILIEWVDNSDNEDGFYIERRQSDELAFTTIKFMAKDATVYTDTEQLINGNNYCYKITAFNQAGNVSSDEICLDLFY